MSLFRTLKRLMSTFRISYFPHCNLSVLVLVESGSLKSHKITGRNPAGRET